MVFCKLEVDSGPEKPCKVQKTDGSKAKELPPGFDQHILDNYLSCLKSNLVNISLYYEVMPSIEYSLLFFVF